MPRLQDEDIQKLSKKIKATRKKKGLTQSDVADRMDISDGHYRKIENGMVDPRFTSLLRLCIALGIVFTSSSQNDGQYEVFRSAEIRLKDS
jgi:transcriptional regulator with XRE-family HTH domain